MDDDRLTLREIAQRASDRHDGAKGREMGRIAERAGLSLTYTTFDKLLTGAYRSAKPRRETLDALAELAGMEPEDVYRAAGQPVPMESFAKQLPPDVDILDGDQREAVIAVIRQLVAANLEIHKSRKEVVGNVGHPAPMNVPLTPHAREAFDAALADLGEHPDGDRSQGEPAGHDDDEETA